MNQIVNGLHGTQAALMQGDCLERMKEIPEGSVDMVFADLPYAHISGGKVRVCTSNTWDAPIDTKILWREMLLRTQKDCTYSMTATQPFTSALIYSNPEMFRYDLIWEKARAVGFLRANKTPLRAHEHVVIFQRGRPVYVAQKTPGKPHLPRVRSRADNYHSPTTMQEKGSLDGSRYPRSVLYFKQDGGGRYHPTAKPVELISWLIRTYTNPGDTVLDPTAGSGTTAVAALNTGRNAICIEKDPTYFDVMCKRVRESQVPAAQTELALG